jgi:Dna[CI] antecedent, DciA
VQRLERHIRNELARFGPSGTIGRLVEVWPGTVGESIARNAWPARVARDGTLHVHTRSAAWAFELTQLAPTILERLRVDAPEAGPRALRFVPGPVPEPPPDGADTRRPAPPQPSGEMLAEAARLAAAVGDENLRELVEKAAAASLARAAADRSF